MEPESRPKILSTEYYRRIYEMEDLHWWINGMRCIAGALLGPPRQSESPLRVLDAGCGTGGTLDWIAGREGAIEGVGVDLVPAALQFCRSRGQRRIALASVCDLPFAGEWFDLIICLDVLQHLPKPGGDIAALGEFHRVLRPGGRVLVRTNALRLGDPKESTDPDFQRYYPEKLAAAARAAGLDPLRVTHANLFDSIRERVRMKKPVERSAPDRHEDQGLPLRLLPLHLRWIGSLMNLGLRAEAFYLKHDGTSLKAGHSIWMLARKP